MIKLAVRFKRPLAFLLAVLLAVIIFPVVGPTSSTLACHYDLEITKTDNPDPVTAGEDLAYTVTVTNNGPYGATGVIVTDILPEGVTFKSASVTKGTATHTGGVVTWEAGTLDMWASAYLTIVVTVDEGTRGTLINTAEVRSNENETDTYPGNNEVVEETVVDTEADLEITKLDSTDPVIAGEGLYYTVTVTNNGPSEASGVEAIDTLPVGVICSSNTASQGTATHVSGVVTWDVGELGSGDSATLTIEVTVTPAAEATLINIAGVSGDDYDPNLENNITTEETTIPAVDHIVIAPADAAIAAGKSQAYTAIAYDEFGNSFDVTEYTDFWIVELGAGGSWSLNTYTYTSEKSGKWTVTGEYKGQSNTATLNVKAGRCDHFVFDEISSPQTAGEPFTVTVTAVDEYGNTATGYVGPADLSDLTGTINPATTGGFTLGIWTGEVTITAAYSGDVITATDEEITGSSNEFDVFAGTLDHFVFDEISSPQVAGEPFTVTVTAVDEYGNTATDYGGTASLSDLTGTIGAATTGGFTLGVWMGEVTITTVYTNDVITATDGDITGDSNPFDVVTGGTIYGTVFDDANGNGLRDDGEAGIPGVTVTLDEETSTITDEYGRYAFTVEASADVHWVVETDPTGYFSTTPNVVYVDVDLSEGYRVDFGDTSTDSEFAVICGTVFDDMDGDGVWDDDEVGIPDVSVTLDGTTSTTTDKYGRYTLIVWAAGSHTVVETDPADYFSTTPNKVHVDANLGYSYQVDFGDASTDSEFAVIYGTVFDDADGDGEWDGDEVGIPDVTVTLDGEASTTTDENGQYMFRLETASVHRVVETDPVGYMSTTPNKVHVDVNQGHSYQVDFGDASTDSEFAVIYGTVFKDTNNSETWDDNEEGIPGVAITLDGEITTTTNRYGQYTFNLGAASIHTVIETDPVGYMSTTPNEVDVDVELGNSYEVNFGDKVQPPTLHHIVISPDTASVTAGDSQTYTAEAFNQYGGSMGDVTSGTTFSIDSGAGGGWFGNVYTSENAGTWEVIGTHNGKSDTATLMVNAETDDGNGDGGDGEERPEYFTVDFLGEITRVPISGSGALLEDLAAPSPDGSHLIEMEQGTRVVDSRGNIVKLIMVTEVEAPELPVNTALLSDVCDFQPSGIVFSIPARITLSYDVGLLPDNTASVALVYYTDELGWTETRPESGVVAELGKESALVNHCTIFAVLAKLDIQSPPSPIEEFAIFEASNLSIIPSEEKIWAFPTFVVITGEEAIVTVDVANSGGKGGYYTAFLKLNGTIVDTQRIYLDPGQTGELSFTIGPNEPGVYQVTIATLAGQFESSVWYNWGLIFGLPAGLILFVLLLWYMRKR